jgi:hypothetical protein
MVAFSVTSPAVRNGSGKLKPAVETANYLATGPSTRRFRFSHHLCIGTDDPLTVASDLRQRYKLVEDALRLGGLSEIDVGWG